MQYGWRSAFFLSVALTTCGKPPPPISPSEPCRAHVGFEMDPRFDARQQLLILEAMGAWEDGTAGYVCFTEREGDAKIVKADVQPLQREIEQEAAEENGLDPGIIVGVEKNNVVYILTGKINGEQDFYATSIHEIGHLLGLDHYFGSEPSWMHPNINSSPQTSRSLTQQDAEAFCDLHEHCKR